MILNRLFVEIIIFKTVYYRLRYTFKKSPDEKREEMVFLNGMPSKPLIILLDLAGLKCDNFNMYHIPITFMVPTSIILHTH